MHTRWSSQSGLLPRPQSPPRACLVVSPCAHRPTRILLQRLATVCCNLSPPIYTPAPASPRAGASLRPPAEPGPAARPHRHPLQQDAPARRAAQHLAAGTASFPPRVICRVLPASTHLCCRPFSPPPGHLAVVVARSARPCNAAHAHAPALLPPCKQSSTIPPAPAARLERRMARQGPTRDTVVSPPHIAPLRGHCARRERRRRCRSPCNTNAVTVANDGHGQGHSSPPN